MGWETIVWGQPPTLLGRLPHAALLAWEERQDLACVCFGTGASALADGMLESEVTLALLFDRIHLLREFDAFRHVPINELEVLLKRVTNADITSQNTAEEVREGLKRFEAMGIQRAVLVSSPTHLPRCLAVACALHEAEPTVFSGTIWASPCATNYIGYGAEDVVVVEPPHRGDRDRSLDAFPLHKMVRRSYHILAHRRRRFLERLDGLLCDFDV